jgi:hypothetical protein
MIYSILLKAMNECEGIQKFPEYYYRYPAALWFSRQTTNISIIT